MLAVGTHCQKIIVIAHLQRNYLNENNLTSVLVKASIVKAKILSQHLINLKVYFSELFF